jgi:hypothetical protein
MNRKMHKTKRNCWGFIIMTVTVELCSVLFKMFCAFIGKVNAYVDLRGEEFVCCTECLRLNFWIISLLRCTNFLSL